MERPPAGMWDMYAPTVIAGFRRCFVAPGAGDIDAVLAVFTGGEEQHYLQRLRVPAAVLAEVGK